MPGTVGTAGTVVEKQHKSYGTNARLNLTPKLTIVD